MSTDTHVRELISGYVLGCLNEEELILVSEHLTDCPACQAELQNYEPIVGQLALAAPDAAPSSALKDRLLAQIQADAEPTHRPITSWWRSLFNLTGRLGIVWTGVGLILILVLAVSNLLLWQRVNRLEPLSQPDRMQAIALDSAGLVPEASGIVTISADGRDGALIVDRFQQLEPEKEYQLWLIRNGQRTSGAIFSVDESGYGGTRIRAPRPLSDYSAVEVTIEPAGGSDRPTGEIILIGSLN